MLSRPIAIIDCAINSPAKVCFDRLAKLLDVPLTYHTPPKTGMSSLIETSQKEEPFAYMIWGSASNVHENLPWQQELKTFMLEEIHKGIPVLGICFGHQLMAQAFGCEVGKIRGLAEFSGMREIVIQSDYKEFKRANRFSMFKLHSYEVKTINDEMIHLASSEEVEYEGLAHKTLPYCGFQGHPEASPQFAEKEFQGDLSDEEICIASNSGLELIRTFIKGLKT